MSRAMQTHLGMLTILALFLTLIVWQLVTGKIIERRGPVKVRRKEQPRAFWEAIAGELILFLAGWSLIYYLSVNYP